MAFNSFNFWLIFPLVFIIFWLIPKRYVKARNAYLILVSYALYMNWKPAFALVLLYVTLVTYYGARLVYPRTVTRRPLRLCVIITLLAAGPLVLFKYYNFVNDNITSLLSSAGLHFALPGLNWAIPVGISFFTFQALGYFFDVYRGRELPEKSLPDYMLFCSFFPQTASGPISTTAELMPQLKREVSFDYHQAIEGLRLVLWGLVLKCVVADRLGLYVDTVMAHYEHFSSLNCFWAAILYTLQIYGDFAGYSLMAVGIAKTLGFNLTDNFRRPYFADSITEFWRRWHITLTRWLTTHVYIPLGGSRCSKTRQYANVMTTFLVSGLWHGANWTFIIWGSLHGCAQIAEKALGLDPKGKLSAHPAIRKFRPVRIIITFLIVTFAWIFFRMPTLADAIAFIGRIFSGIPGGEFMEKASNTDRLLTLFAICLLFAAEARREYLSERLSALDSPKARWITCMSLFCILLCMGVLDSGSFIYVNF
ncbi:MAG: MBOAT family protein [Bacteroidales bacterium]|nr:MBOAT family protein [Bacteroidales bacterium]